MDRVGKMIVAVLLLLAGLFFYMAYQQKILSKKSVALESVVNLDDFRFNFNSRPGAKDYILERDQKISFKCPETGFYTFDGYDISSPMIVYGKNKGQTYKVSWSSTSFSIYLKKDETVFLSVEIDGPFYQLGHTQIWKGGREGGSIRLTPDEYHEYALKAKAGMRLKMPTWFEDIYYIGYFKAGKLVKELLITREFLKGQPPRLNRNVFFLRFFDDFDLRFRSAETTFFVENRFSLKKEPGYCLKKNQTFKTNYWLDKGDVVQIFKAYQPLDIYMFDESEGYCSTVNIHGKIGEKGEWRHFFNPEERFFHPDDLSFHRCSDEAIALFNQTGYLYLVASENVFIKHIEVHKKSREFKLKKGEEKRFITPLQLR